MLFIGLLVLTQISWSSGSRINCAEKGPVCGTDGKTYANMCRFIVAKIEDPDLQVLHDGPCRGRYKNTHYQLLSDDNGSWSIKPNIKPRYVGQAQHRGKSLKSAMPQGWPVMGPIYEMRL